MAPKLSPQERLKLIEKVVRDGRSVTQVCQEAGISRVIFYRWLTRYKEEGTTAPKKLQGDRPSSQVSPGKVGQIIALVCTHPSWSSHKISQKLTLGNHGVYNVLKRLNLNTASKRKKFARQAKGLTDKQALKLAKGVLPPAKKRAPELSPQERMAMIRQVVEDKQPIAQVCREFEISRPAFYKWYARYCQAPAEKKLAVLEDKKPKIDRYWRQTPEKYEEAILAAVAKYPQFGVKKIVATLPKIAGKPIAGSHGVQRVLERNDLSTYEKRLAYAQAQVTPITGLISTWQSLFAKLFVPPKTRQAIVRFVSITTFSCFLTIVTLGLVGYFGTMFSQAPGVSKIGLFFASTALLMGSAFFAYSMKYYITLALVLSFSRQSLEREGKEGEESREGSAGGLQPSLEHVKLGRYPFVSIHIPLYNEKKVAQRVIKACLAMKYPGEFEVIVCDDSNDETTAIVQDFAARWNSKILKTKNQKPKTQTQNYKTINNQQLTINYQLLKLNPALLVSLVINGMF